MDQEKYFAQMEVFSLSTVRIGLYQTCTRAEDLFQEYSSKFHSLTENLLTFNDHQLHIYRTLRDELMPAMTISMNRLILYKGFIDNCFENNYSCLNLPKEYPNRTIELQTGISDTRSALDDLCRSLHHTECIYLQFSQLVNLLHNI